MGKHSTSIRSSGIFFIFHLVIYASNLKSVSAEVRPGSRMTGHDEAKPYYLDIKSAGMRSTKTSA
jgi:hypothetical protein